MRAMQTAVASGQVASLASEYWETFLELDPLWATQLGDSRYDDRLPDLRPEARATARTRFAALLGRIATIDATALRGEDRITLSALRESIASDLAHIDTALGDWTVDPLEGIPVGMMNIPDYSRVVTPEDGARMVARWRALGPYVDTHADNLRRALADDRVACRTPIERNLLILAEVLDAPTADWRLLAPAADARTLDDWSDADRDRFARDLHAAAEEAVRPALGRLVRVLRDEILPAARPPDLAGLSSVPGGRDAYRRLIRVHTSLDLEPEELHAIGLAEIERIDAEIVELAGRTLGARTLDDALARLRSDPSLYFSTPAEVREVAERSLARAEAAVPGWFGRLPRAACVVVEMGSHEQEHSTIAYYRQPAPDGSRPGQYYLNTSSPETRPRYEAEVLAYHEAVPGHHLQIAIGQELTDLPEFRRHLGPTAYFEGWGLYIERLADEMGLYSGDLDRIGALSFDAWRAGRLVVDTGLHALGWSRDRAIAFMSAHSALAPNNIANEVDRYIVWPGQALAYKTGQLEMLRLRNVAQARLGPAFDIRGFHDAVLGHGAVALSTLSTIVEAWVDDRPRPPDGG
jgi:uncharacterized protein (DUF885 family)